jgi:hypothetical protein
MRGEKRVTIRIPDTKNRALVGAFKRGMRDAENGEHRNPYGDLRAGRGSVTFSRAFSRFWTRGHDLRMDELQQNGAAHAARKGNHGQE